MRIKKSLFICGLILSFLFAIVIVERKGDAWEEVIRKCYYNSFLINDSIPGEYKVAVDSKGIPYVNYYEIKNSEQYNPTIVSSFATKYYDQFKQSKDSDEEKSFFNCVQWITSNLEYTNNHALFKLNWKTPFYPDIETPYTSSIASGLAIEVLIDAYQITDSTKYLRTAKSILSGFYISIQKGGFSYQNPEGWWFEEYADTNARGPRILNGHISALLRAYQFYQVTKDDSAYFLFQQGLKGLRINIHLYDAGDGWSYYDIYKKRADKKYQRVIVDQMEELYAITHEDLFYKYFKKWETPLKEPYAMRIVKEKNKSGAILFIGLWTMMLVFCISVHKLFLRFKQKTRHSQQA